MPDSDRVQDSQTPPSVSTGENIFRKSCHFHEQESKSATDVVAHRHRQLAFALGLLGLGTIVLFGISIAHFPRWLGILAALVLVLGTFLVGTSNDDRSV